MPYSWILFDADNTLFDFDRAEKSALANALNDAGVPTEDYMFGLYNTINKACWQDFEEGKISRQTLRTLRFERFFDEIGKDTDIPSFAINYLQYLAQGSFLYDGVEILLANLAETHKIGLITNGLKEVQRPRLERSGIQHLFNLVVVSDEVGASKPDAAFFDFAFLQMGKPGKEEAIVVGDSLSADIAGGNNYGLHTCWYNPERVANRLGITPTYEIHALEAIKTIL